MLLDSCIKQVAKELGIPEDVCHRAYMSAWKFIHDKTKQCKLTTDTPIEEFNSYRWNFNVRGIGKFYITPKEFIKKNKQYLAIQKYKKENYDKSHKND